MKKMIASSKVDPKSAYFIRLDKSAGIKPATQKRLLAARYIAISEASFIGRKDDLYKFRHLALLGGNVLIVTGDNNLRIGSVEEGASVTQNGCLHEIQLAKLIQLSNESKLRLRIGFPNLRFCVWHKACQRLDDLLHPSDLRMLDLGKMLPQEIEIMCVEFLRLPKARSFGLPQIVHLLAQVGGSRKAIDFEGVSTDGERVLGQVTHTHSEQPDIDKKVNALKSWSQPGFQCVFFARACESKFSDGVHFFALEKVFEVMREEPLFSKGMGLDS